VGSCWAGRHPNGATDTHCFSAVYKGQFIRDVHELTGGPRPYAGETLYHWDARDKVVRYTYWNSSGGVSTGTMHVEGDRLIFPESHESAGGRKVEYRNVWVRQGEDAYLATMDELTPQGWVERLRVVHTRTTRPHR
jgi:hypothetical protein